MKKLLFLFLFIPFFASAQFDGLGKFHAVSVTTTGGDVINYTTKYSSTYTVLVTDYAITCYGTITLDLPTAVGKKGQQFVIKNNGTGIVTIDPYSTETIDGYSNTIMSCQHNSQVIVSNDTNWVSVGGTYFGASPHATISSSVDQTVAATNLAYPVIFENDDDLQGVFRRTGTVTISQATPAVVTWTDHKLDTGAVIRFTTTGGLPAPLAINTNYYIINAGFSTNAFRLSTTYNGTAINTTTPGTGVHTARCVSRLYFYEGGDYLINISAIVTTGTNTDAVFDIWFAEGNLTDDFHGTNIPASNTRITMVTNAESKVLAVPFIYDFHANDFFKLMYHGGNTSLFLDATAAQTIPLIPLCPSIIVSVNKTGR